jgi:hypothetical protein
MSDSAVDFLSCFHEKVCALSKSLVFNKNEILHFHVMSLYGSILEHTSSILILTKDSPRSAIPVVFRTLLEAALDLLNLCQEPKYGYRLEVDNLRLKKELLGLAIRGESEHLKELSQNPDLSKQYKEVKKELQSLESRGFKRIEMAEKFSLLSMNKEYLYIYKMLNHHAHNSITSLKQRHITTDKDDFQVIFFNDTPLMDIEPYLGMTMELIMRCSEKLHERFKSSAINEIQELRRDFNAFKENIVDT